MVSTRWLLGDNAPNIHRDLLGQIEVDVIEDLRVRLVHDRIIAVAELKRQSRD